MNKKETIKNVKQLVTAVYPHYDRITFTADADVSFLDLKKLSNPNPHPDPRKKRKHAVILKTDTPFNQSTYKIRLYQPTRDNIEYLIKAIANEPVYIHVSYVEVTYDFTGENYMKLSETLVRHLVITKTHSPFYKKDREMHYWGYREKNVSKMFPLLYSDKKSKIVGGDCAHFEFRLFGKSKCDEHQLSSPSDFLHFDFASFFIANTKFYLPPSKTVLGDFINQDQDQTCNTPRSKQKLFDRVAETGLLSKDDPIQKFMQVLPSLKEFYGSRPIQAKNKQFTANFQNALLANIKPF